jgi:hypothetical protein
VAGPRRCLGLGTRVLTRRLVPRLVGPHWDFSHFDFVLLPIRVPRCGLVVVKEILWPKSSNVTSARSDLAPKAFLSSSDLPITTSRSSGLPLSQISNLPDVSLACKDAKTQAVKLYPQVDASTTTITFIPGVAGPSLYSIGRSVSRRRWPVCLWKGTERLPPQRQSHFLVSA